MNISEIFKFDKKDIEYYLLHTLKLRSKFINSFDYLLNKLCTNEIVSDLSTLKWSKGKSYDWVALHEDDLFLLIRKYRTHFTIFFKNKSHENKYGCFIFNTNKDILSDSESDARIDDNFKDLNIYLKDIIVLIKTNKIYLLENSYAFKRPKYIEVKNVWNGDDNEISSIDSFTFCCEEMFHKYYELFSENEMFEKIKTFKKNDKIGSYKILKVHKKLKNNYYHDIGLTLQGTNGKDSEVFKDIYCLTRYYYNEVFGIKEK